MRTSHRDRRVVRDIARSTWGMLGLVVVLSALALVAPLEAIRFAAVLGLAVSGGVFLWQSSRTVEEYVLDLEQVQLGGDVSGRVRVEVTSDVGPDPNGRRLSRALPLVRRRPPASPPDPPAASR